MFSEDDFAQRLSNLRTNKGISARDMSLSLGQNPNYINMIENGRAFPTMSNFFAICDFLNVTPSEFFNLEIPDPNKLDSVISYLKKMNIRQIEAVEHLLKEFMPKIN